MSAPSFSSFPPSFSSFPDIEAKESHKTGDSGVSPREQGKRKRGSSKDKERRRSKSRDRERGYEKDRKREKDKDKRKGKEKDEYEERGHKDKHRHHRKHKDKKRRHSRSPSSDVAEKSSQKQRDDAIEPDDDKTYRFFVVDRKGDPLNLQYGGIYAGDIPRYHVVGGGKQIIGLSGAWTAFRRTGKGIEVGLRGTQKLTGLSDSSTRSLLALPSKKLLPPEIPSSYPEEEDGFIRILKPRERRDPEDSYRSITTAQDLDSDSEISQSAVSEEGSSDGSPMLSAHQITLRNIEQDLAQNPRAIDKWISLLNHTLSTIPVTSKNATKARSEITVSIMSRALSADPENASSKILWLRYMKAGEEIWQEDALKAEWERALKVGGIEIWIEWLEWRIRRCTKGIDGLVDDVLPIYRSFGTDESGELAKLRVFWRTAVTFQMAGYREKAMAMFQAQAELIFKTPQNLMNAPFEVKLRELEEFWESEHPRIGEDGAHGWAKWYLSGKPENAPNMTSQSKPSSDDIAQLDPYRQWAFFEHQRDQATLLPSKSFDEVAEIDPYTTVLFSDIRALLFEIKHSETRNAFRLTWLSFLGLHIPGIASLLSLDQHLSRDLDWDDRWNSGYLTNQPHLDVIFPTETSRKALTAEAAAGVLVGKQREYADSFRMPVKEWGKDVVGCLDFAVNGSKELRSWWNQEDVSGIDVLVVRSVFAQLRGGNEDVRWDEFALAFECAVNLKGSLKLSRSLLSTTQDSLLHWADHAQLERMRGRLDDARKVYHTVLITSKPVRAARGFSILWYNWAEMEWLAGKDDQAVNIIVRAVDLDNANSGVVILRAKRALEDNVESSQVETRGEVRWKEREAWIKLRALLELLTGKNVDAMLHVFDGYLSTRPSKDVIHESMLVASLVMLYRYGFVLKNPMPPTTLRERASMALEQYPNNSIILGMFLEGEKGQGVWGRVRALFGENETDIGRMKGVTRRIQEIWIAGWERGRWGSEIERTRDGLAGAVESERTRASAIIWRVYLEFEIRTGNLEKAKKILFRAIGECPLYKELYLLAFGVLRSVFSVHELNALADLMAERGLRMHKGLDDVLEGWDMGGIEPENREQDNAEAEDSGDSEIEHRAKELRRLMPY